MSGPWYFFPRNTPLSGALRTPGCHHVSYIQINTTAVVVSHGVPGKYVARKVHSRMHEHRFSRERARDAPLSHTFGGRNKKTEQYRCCSVFLVILFCLLKESKPPPESARAEANPTQRRTVPRRRHHCIHQTNLPEPKLLISSCSQFSRQKILRWASRDTSVCHKGLLLLYTSSASSKAASKSATRCFASPSSLSPRSKVLRWFLDILAYGIRRCYCCIHTYLVCLVKGGLVVSQAFICFPHLCFSPEKGFMMGF